jgi:hypothetical protein
LVEKLRSACQVVPIEIPNRANCAHAVAVRSRLGSAIDYRHIAGMPEREPAAMSLHLIVH